MFSDLSLNLYVKYKINLLNISLFLSGTKFNRFNLPLTCGFTSMKKGSRDKLLNFYLFIHYSHTINIDHFIDKIRLSLKAFYSSNLLVGGFC